MPAPLVARHRGTHPVGWEIQDSRSSIECPPPMLELTGLIFILERLALPRSEIAVLKEKGWEISGSIRTDRFVELAHLFEEHADRPPIHDDVVHGQHQHVLFGRQAQQFETNQWTVAQIKSAPPFFGR